MLAGLLTEAAGSGDEVELVFESADPALLAAPFEAARLKDGRAPALEPGVRMLRRVEGAGARFAGPFPGPLKILVAVGAPDEGKGRGSVLDVERELQTILDAVERARQYGNAYVRILEVGSPEEIGKALAEQSYHVLHLSGHGQAGALELEDEDGGAAPTGAGRLAEVIRDSGHPAPLVFLACCHSGRGESETVSLAQGLLAGGVPMVLAMQAAVSDRYSTELARTFYEELARHETPLASRALAVARRKLEKQRQEALARGESPGPAEYATAGLFLAGAEAPVLDRSLDKVEPVLYARRPASGAVPMLDIGDLIGRRVEVRRVYGC